MAGVYGLRRSEVVGLKWSAISFDRKCIEIKHTVTTANLDGKEYIVSKDSVKTDSSLRSLPLTGELLDMLKRMKEQQERNRQLFGSAYYEEDRDYIYVDQLGHRIKPGYISETFGDTLKKLKFRHIRYHDLRHTCASMLLAAEVDLKAIQEWLGHSSYATTANLYTHLHSKSKKMLWVN